MRICLLVLGCLLLFPATTCARASETGGKASEPVRIGEPPAGETDDVLPRSWLKRKTTVEEEERKHMVKNDELGSEPVPFGFINKRWLELKTQIQEGDELWEFSSSAESWKHLAGRSGLCIVRKGRIIASLVTLMN